jgi:hypothetical protein
MAVLLGPLKNLRNTGVYFWRNLKNVQVSGFLSMFGTCAYLKDSYVNNQKHQVLAK